MPEPTDAPPIAARPPNTHQLALMIWLAAFPTLTVINLALRDWLAPMSTVVRTLVLATIAVPIVIYGVMPQLHRLRVRLLSRAGGRRTASNAAILCTRVNWPRRARGLTSAHRGDQATASMQAK